jgi:uncharacterized membrane protein
MSWKPYAIAAAYIFARLLQIALALIAVSFGVLPFTSGTNVLTGMFALLATGVIVLVILLIEVVVIRPLQRTEQQEA